MQLKTHLVLEQDEGFQQHLPLRGVDGLEHARKEFLAVFQQPHAIAAAPAGRWGARPPQGTGSATASSISMRANRGRWSDRCDHGRIDNTSTRLARALRI